MSKRFREESLLTFWNIPNKPNSVKPSPEKRNVLGKIWWNAARDQLQRLEEMILRQKNSGGLILSGEKCTRYQPTSGSTSRVKWIPYTKKFLSEIDAVVSPFAVNGYDLEKRIFRGSQYWSLSWIPTDLRKNDDSNTNDDLEVLPWWKKIFTSLYNGRSPVHFICGNVGRFDDGDAGLHCRQEWSLILFSSGVPPSLWICLNKWAITGMSLLKYSARATGANGGRNCLLYPAPGQRERL